MLITSYYILLLFIYYLFHGTIIWDLEHQKHMFNLTITKLISLRRSGPRNIAPWGRPARWFLGHATHALGQAPLAASCLGAWKRAMWTMVPLFFFGCCLSIVVYLVVSLVAKVTKIYKNETWGDLNFETIAFGRSLSGKLSGPPNM